MQLLNSEGVINSYVDGFNDGGERNLKVLERNSPENKKGVAGIIANLIKLHKEQWIDETIAVRHQLIHPKKMFRMATFELFLELDGPMVNIKNVRLPQIGKQLLIEALSEILNNLNKFIVDYIALLKNNR